MRVPECVRLDQTHARVYARAPEACACECARMRPDACVHLARCMRPPEYVRHACMHAATRTHACGKPRMHACAWPRLCTLDERLCTLDERGRQGSCVRSATRKWRDPYVGVCACVCVCVRGCICLSHAFACGRSGGREDGGAVAHAYARVRVSMRACVYVCLRFCASALLRACVRAR
eukprot:2353542-Pleurochrysis_carterae.AAC.1